MAENSSNSKKVKQLSIEEYSKIKEKLAKSKAQAYLPLDYQNLFYYSSGLLRIPCHLLPSPAAFYRRTLITMTDTAVLILSIFFLIRGASRGFINSLLIPFSIIVATIISIIYYQITKEMIVSLLIGLIGPLLLNLGIRVLLKKLAKATNSEIKPNFWSRLGGACLTLAWGWVFIIFALILLVSLPTWGNTLTAIHNDVIKSASYSFRQTRQ